MRKSLRRILASSRNIPLWEYHADRGESADVRANDRLRPSLKNRAAIGSAQDGRERVDGFHRQAGAEDRAPSD